MGHIYIHGDTHITVTSAVNCFHSLTTKFTFLNLIFYKITLKCVFTLTNSGALAGWGGGGGGGAPPKKYCGGGHGPQRKLFRGRQSIKEHKIIESTHKSASPNWNFSDPIGQ